MKPKRYLQATILGFLLIQNGSIINHELNLMKPVSIFKAQLEYHNTIYTLLDKTYNDIHPLSLIAS